MANHNGYPETPLQPDAVAVVNPTGEADLLYSGPDTELIERVDITVQTSFTSPVEELSFPEEVYAKEYDPESGDLEVHVASNLTREDYQAVTPPDEWELLEEYAKKMEGKRVVRINATAVGGGVAIMNAPWVHLMRSLGVDAHWYALKPDEEAAKVTKWKFHNVLQDVAPEGTELTPEDEATYEGWMEENVELLREPLGQADVIIIDDWQPSGLIASIKGGREETPDGPVHHLGINPDAPLLFRDHIHTEGELMGTPGTPQNKTWQYLWERNRINEADVFITHPKDEFVPPNVSDEKVVFMPATIDTLDDLNRDITDAEKQAGKAFINEHLALNEGQEPLDFDNPYIVLIARFDESKGMPQGIESYAKARRQMLEQGVKESDIPPLVLMGNGSVDDPSGTIVLEEIMTLRELAGTLDPELYGDIKNALKVIRVPHNDIAINTVLKGAMLALQPSIAEGCEARVTDAIWQGVPVIGSDRGGIPLQIREGLSGHIVSPHDTDKWAGFIVSLTTDTERYEALKKTTKEMAVSHNRQFTTIPNVTRWLFLSHTLLTNETSFQGNRRWAEELAAAA
jgi:glycosyltransferase involved in cell wall biosynthesis